MSSISNGIGLYFKNSTYSYNFPEKRGRCKIIICSFKQLLIVLSKYKLRMLLLNTQTYIKINISKYRRKERVVFIDALEYNECRDIKSLLSWLLSFEITVEMSKSRSYVTSHKRLYASRCNHIHIHKGDFIYNNLNTFSVYSIDISENHDFDILILMFYMLLIWI